MPSEVTIEGTIRLATATKNRRFDPLKPLAKREAGAEREQDGEDHHHEAELERTQERVVDVDDAPALPKLREPVERKTVQREGQAASSDPGTTG